MNARVLVLLALAACTARATPERTSVLLGARSVALPPGGTAAIAVDARGAPSLTLDLPPGVEGEVSRRLLVVRVAPDAAPGLREVLVHARDGERTSAAALRVEVLASAPIAASREDAPRTSAPDDAVAGDAPVYQ